MAIWICNEEQWEPVWKNVPYFLQVVNNLSCYKDTLKKKVFLYTGLDFFLEEKEITYSEGI